MADIRIKDLTTTASSTASDDFIAVDGTTNGTRKLNAFSPTFGGNATVTGTLTVNGSTLTSAGSLLVNGATSAALFSGQATVAIKGGSGGAAIYLSDATGSTPGATSPTLHFASSTDGISLRASSGVFQVIDETQPGAGDGSLRLSVTNAGVVSIPATTASTTTSTGALVVSGGVGVAGKVNAGSFTTTGHTTSAVENVNVSTTAVDIAIATSVGAIYFVSGYNNSGGAQGTWLLMVRGSNVTTVSSDNNTGLTVTFSFSSGKLQAATASGTLVTNAYAITR